MRPVLAADLQDVSEPRRNNERSACATAFQQGVGRNGGPVDEEGDVSGGYIQPPNEVEDTLGYALRLITGDGRGLGELQAVGGDIEQGQVSESAPDVHSQAVGHLLLA